MNNKDKSSILSTEPKEYIVLSLFDGISCGKVALDRAGIKVKKYYASEIDKFAIYVSEKNHPEVSNSISMMTEANCFSYMLTFSITLRV